MKQIDINGLIPYEYDIYKREGGCSVLFYVPYKPFLAIENTVYIDACYIASNAAYKTTERVCGELRKDGVECFLKPAFDYKSAVCSLSGAQGKNTLCYRKGSGCFFSIGAFNVSGFEVKAPVSKEKPVMPCSGCDKCVKVCRTGAFEGGFIPERCVRHYSFSVDEAPYGILKSFTQIIGCSLCREVCPANKEITAEEMPPELKEYLNADNFINVLLNGDLRGFAEFFGGNYCNRNALLSSLIVVLANQNQKERLQKIFKREYKSQKINAAIRYAEKVMENNG